MGTTFQDLLNSLIDVRDADYRTDPERDEAILKELTYQVQTILEKLRDRFPNG